MNIGVEDGAAASAVKLGLKQNWRQFALLLLVNAFVGGMVSIERTVVPLIGSEYFHIASTTKVGRITETSSILDAARANRTMRTGSVLKGVRQNKSLANCTALAGATEPMAA
jgi:hypothetical protein